MRYCFMLLLMGMGAPVLAQGDFVRGAQVYAGVELTGQPLGLAVDDAGHVFLSCTGRAFGRGVPDLSEKEKLREEDGAIFALSDRREALERWKKDGKVPAAPPDAAESVVCLTDANGDGKADVRVIVAGDFRDVLDGPAGGLTVLADGAVLFGCTPSLWRLEDDNHDLRADRRLAILTGFGIRCGGGEPGLRALTEGPDGFIYFTTTERGSRVVSQEGERFGLEGTGGVWRCLPDGSGLEVLASGLHDPAGIAVDLRGRVYVADALPGGEETRVLRVLPGADFSTKVPGLELGTVKGRAAGLIIGPKVPATGALPSLLMAEGRAGGAVIPLTLKEVNGGVQCEAGEPVWQGSAAGGLATGPDGCIYWAEWDRGLTAKASVKVLRLAPQGNEAVWREGAALLAGGIAAMPAGDLPGLLEHGHPLVRRRAVRALVKEGFQESLDHFTRTARRSPSLPARLDALWGIAALARTMPMLLNEVQLLTGSAEADIRALAVHVTGEANGEMPVQELLPLLRDPSRDVREEVAIALGRLRPTGVAEDIFTAIHQCGDGDGALRQALLYALSRILPAEEIAARGKGTSSAFVKAAAVAVLGATGAAETADFLDDENPEIVMAAGRAIYDRRILPGYPGLAKTLERCAGQPALTAQPDFVKRALAAAWRTGSAEAAAAVAAFAEGEKVPEELKKKALEILSGWDEPPAREAVHGRYDPPLPRAKGLARGYVERLKPNSSGAKPDAAALAAKFYNEKLEEDVRVEALQQLASLQGGKALEAARSILPAGGTPGLRMAARGIIMRLDAGSSYAVLNEALALGSVPEMQAALVQAQRFDSRQSDVFWLTLGKRLMEDKVAPAVELEIWESLQLRDVAPRGPYRRFLETARTGFDESANPLARWRFCETGGDAGKGRRLYETGRVLNCTACHSLQGRGGMSGPELDHVAARLNRSQLLGSLVQPSAVIAAGCGMVTVTLQDGGTVSGVLRKRDDTTLVMATGHGYRRINAEAVQSLTTPVSAMPAAATLLTLREIRDLLAWLETLK